MILFPHNSHILSLGTMVETQKRFSKQMSLFFLLRKEQEKFNIETYF